jgi:galactose mutarotase-like enzyme
MPFHPYHNYHHERNFGCRITECVLKGFRSLILENNLVRVTILADKGTDIYELLYKPSDLDAMWRAPLGLRERHSNITPREHESGKFLDFAFGGWFEMFPNAGYHFDMHGFPWGLHGEVSLQSWEYQIVRDDPDEIAVKFLLRTARMPFHLEKTIRLIHNKPTLFFNERIINEGDQPLDVSWGQHPVYGWPFVDDSSRLYLPSCRAMTFEEKLAPTTRFKPGQDCEWPFVETLDGQIIDASQIPGPETHSHDHIYLTGYQEGWYALTNENLAIGLGLKFDPDLYKYLTFWQVYRGAYDYPWWGMTYNIAIEPQTSYPNHLPDQIKAGNALHFEPGETIETEYLATFYEGVTPVKGITNDGKVTIDD